MFWDSADFSRSGTAGMYGSVLDVKTVLWMATVRF